MEGALVLEGNVRLSGDSPRFDVREAVSNEGRPLPGSVSVVQSLVSCVCRGGGLYALPTRSLGWLRREVPGHLPPIAARKKKTSHAQCKRCARKRIFAAWGGSLG